MQYVGKAKLGNTLQFTNNEDRKECKSKWLSWVAYNALDGKRGEGILHHYSWMTPLDFCGQYWATPPLRLMKTCIKQQGMLAGKW